MIVELKFFNIFNVSDLFKKTLHFYETIATSKFNEQLRIFACAVR